MESDSESGGWGLTQSPHADYCSQSRDDRSERPPRAPRRRPRAALTSRRRRRRSAQGYAHRPADLQRAAAEYASAIFVLAPVSLSDDATSSGPYAKGGASSSVAQKLNGSRGRLGGGGGGDSGGDSVLHCDVLARSESSIVLQARRAHYFTRLTGQSVVEVRRTVGLLVQSSRASV